MQQAGAAVCFLLAALQLDDAVGDESADGEAWAMRGHAVAAVAMTSSPHSAGSTGTALTSTTGLCFFD